jgi:hypothetical protein
LSGIYLDDKPDGDDPYEKLAGQIDEVISQLYAMREKVSVLEELATQLATHIANSEGKAVGLLFDLPQYKGANI